MTKSIFKLLCLPFLIVCHIIEILFKAFFLIVKFFGKLFVASAKFSFFVAICAVIIYFLDHYNVIQTGIPSIPDRIKTKEVPEKVISLDEPRNTVEFCYRTYEFSDNRSRKYKLEHAISMEDIDETETFYGFSKQDLFRLLDEKTQGFNDEYEGSIQVTLSRDLSYQIRYQAGYAGLMKEFERVYRETIEEYCRGNMVLPGPFGPDYRTIQKWQAEFVKPLFDRLLTLAQEKNMNEREFIILMSRFVQHLQYRVPPEQSDKEIFGFWPPLTCLKEKAGDCDSKSTLFASIFYHYRKNSLILILTRNHAFIGIRNQHKKFPTDNSLKISGIDYLLLETTSAYRLGSVHKDVLNQLKKRQYKYIQFF